ncbi:MAG: N-acetylmuramoyl-L-alanine amidase [Deltaproteobacteria bacterium]|nr:N-acetylmuramoyl-L-alanine amidase [Deltaproteobacteria bacterium]
MKKWAFCICILMMAAGTLPEPPEALSRSKAGPVTLLARADRCRKTLYASSKKRKYRHNWLKCIELHRKIQRTYPKSDQAVWACYHSANLYTGLYRYSGRSRDLNEALALYRNLVEDHRDHSLADDAQYKIGEIFYKFRKDPAQAYVEFLKVDVNFPSGDMRPRARRMLDRLALTLRSKNKKKGQGKASVSRSGPVQVKDIRYWSTSNYTRVVIDLQGPVRYEHHLLKEDPNHRRPRRLYLDLKNARVPRGIDKVVPIKNDLLRTARAGQYTRNTVRVVLDIEKIGGYKVFHLYDPFRIVVDVRRFKKKGDTKIRPELASKERSVRKGIRKEKSPAKGVSLARQLGLHVKTIVIDPGHGGKDPGCHLGGRYREKNITLSIARFLAKELRKRLGCQVFLTRNKDVFLSLEKRTAIANMKKADLFISLHVNAHRDRRIHGLETYFLNMATDERAVMVAARENATSEKNISDLQTILNDLMLNTKINESSRLAHFVQNGMVLSVKKWNKGVRSLGVKQAPFYVLIGAQMPAVLVEVGFLSNKWERKRLLNKKYQKRVAEGIYAGISSYIRSIGQIYQGG